MPTRVFVSYSHQEGEWVWDRLVPCLSAAGLAVLIDRERFLAGRSLAGQMDSLQDAADLQILVLSPHYLASRYCQHEMEHAVAKDPDFTRGIVIPVIREQCTLPDPVRLPDPLWVDLHDDQNVLAWDFLLRACGADLGTPAPTWLRARDDVRGLLSRNESVHLLVTGRVRWRELISHLRQDHFPDLSVVDLRKPTTISRRGLVVEILRTLSGRSVDITPTSNDLAELEQALAERGPHRLALTHFDEVSYRHDYGRDFFTTLHYLLVESRTLVLLIQSRASLSALLPDPEPLSPFDVQTVALRARS